MEDLPRYLRALVWLVKFGSVFMVNILGDKEGKLENNHPFRWTVPLNKLRKLIHQTPFGVCMQRYDELWKGPLHLRHFCCVYQKWCANLILKLGELLYNA
jgi:hypothetical protein